MHELSIVSSLVENVLNFVETQPVKRVIAVRLAIGELTCVEAEQIRFCYDLVTEGTLTLAKVADLLERRDPGAFGAKPNGAQSMARLMLESDIVEFVVGTRINEAHQDPNVPVELDLRRNIVRRLASLLETKLLKETSIRFV